MRALLAIPLVLAACFSKPDRPGGGPNDGGPDAPIDGPDSELCFGKDAFTVCLPALPSTELLTLSSAINTDEAACTGGDLGVVDPMNGGPKLCVARAKQVSISGTVNATGDLPLVVIATEGALTVETSALLDATSDQGNIGAGANFALGCDPGTPAGGSSGGGAGGSFGTRGGVGGLGKGNTTGGVPGSPDGADKVRGGCAGGAGGGGAPTTSSGGAVYLIAAGTLTVNGSINASGSGGPAGQSVDGGGDGGGSGGLIALHAATIVANGAIWANGGGGGGGAAGGDGGDGGESTAPAMRAIGGTPNGGGTDGGTGAVAIEDGATAAASSKGGGGGGGGGGVIKIVSGQVLAGTNFSPPPI